MDRWVTPRSISVSLATTVPAGALRRPCCETPARPRGCQWRLWPGSADSLTARSSGARLGRQLVEKATGCSASGRAACPRRSMFMRGLGEPTARITHGCRSFMGDIGSRTEPSSVHCNRLAMAASTARIGPTTTPGCAHSGTRHRAAGTAHAGRLRQRRVNHRSITGDPRWRLLLQPRQHGRMTSQGILQLAHLRWRFDAGQGQQTDHAVE